MSEVPEGYIFEKKRGKEFFGEIYLTSKKGTNEKFFTKKADKSIVLIDKIKKYIYNEIFILKRINHPNILKLVELKNGINHFFLIFEACNGGRLSDILEKYKEKYKKPFPQEIVQYLMRQIISFFTYLHDMKFSHGKIKLNSILINFPTEVDKQNLNLLSCQVKIKDFGFSSYLKLETLSEGTFGNPKIDNTQNFDNDQKADIWNLGCICYEMLIGTPAFDDSSMDELCMKIKKRDYKIPHDIILSYEAISFLNGMIQYNPQRRLDIHQLASQYFLTKNVRTFHLVQRKKSKMDLGQNIFLNSKETNLVLSEFDHQKLDKKIQKGNENDEEDLDVFLQDAFDIMNIDTFYIEPLIIPTKPLDDMNNIDLASNFIDDV